MAISLYILGEILGGLKCTFEKRPLLEEESKRNSPRTKPASRVAKNS